MTEQIKNCFIVMPISDSDGYDTGHFARVYEHLIAPACVAAGYKPIRADDVKATNHIVLDILERIVKSDLVVCDLSAKNPNVMYELGIRQAFDLPVVLLKDKRTDRVFDIQGLRTLDYDETLRIDRIKSDVEALCSAIEATTKPESHEVNSLVRLLGVAGASLPAKADISADTAMILKGLNDISQRLTRVEEQSPEALQRDFLTGSVKVKRLSDLFNFNLPSGEKVKPGVVIFDGNGNEVGKLTGVNSNGVAVDDGRGTVIISPDDERYMRLTKVSF